MRYRLQRVDLHSFLTSEVPLEKLSPDLRQRIRHALSVGGDLRELGAVAARELLAQGLLRPFGSLREQGQRVLLYSLPGSERVYDLRTLLDARPPATPERRPPSPVPSKTRASETPPAAPRANGDAWASLSAIRATLRRDWVSFGLEASLEALLGEIKLRLGAPELRLLLWQERLGVPVAEADDWEILTEGEAMGILLRQGLQDAPDTGFVHDGLQWFAVWARQNIVGALGGDPAQNPALLAEAAGALSDLVQAVVRSQRRVYTDPLTGVNNRSFFDHQIGVELERSRRASLPMGYLFADLDHFKRVNDEHGHEAGDLVLQHVAQLFLSHLRRIDYVFRWGGEEFAMILPGTDAQEALATAERLRRVVELTPLTLPDGTVLRVTVSIGAAAFPDHASGERELMRRADQALYVAKDEGRNRVHLWQA